MSLFKEWYGNFIVEKDNTKYTLTPHYARVHLSVTDEPFESEIRWINNNEFGNTISPNVDFCGSTLYITADTTPLCSNTLFVGRVFKIGEEFTGEFKEKSERYLVAYGWGRDLQDLYRLSALPANTVNALVATLSQELIDRNVIVNYNYNSPSHPYIKKLEKEKSYWDFFESICKEGDYDFYVDNYKVLKMFRRGYSTFPTVITPDFKAKIEWNIMNIINTIDVVGATTIVGSDLDYTESLVNWNGQHLYLDSNTKAIGNYAVKSYCLTPNEPNAWCELTISAFASTLVPRFDLGGVLHFRYYYETRNPIFDWREVKWHLYNVHPIRMRISFMKDNSNYFYNDLKIAGGSWFTNGWFRCGFTEMNVGFNLEDPFGYSIVGNPSWDSISKIRWEILEPSETEVRALWIDDLWFDAIGIVGRSKDSLSISKFGLRHKILKDGNLLNQSIADSVANYFIDMYKNPKLIAENIDVDPDKVWNLPLGYRCTVSVYDKTINAEIRSIDFEFTEKGLSSKISVSEVFVPKIERIMKVMSSALEYLNWDIERFRLIANQFAVFDTATGIYGWEKLNEHLGLELLMRLEDYDLYTMKDDFSIGNLSFDSDVKMTTDYIRFELVTSSHGHLFRKDTMLNPQITHYFKSRIRLQTPSGGGYNDIFIGTGKAFQSGGDPYYYLDVNEALGFLIKQSDNNHVVHRFNGQISLGIPYGNSLPLTTLSNNQYCVVEYDLIKTESSSNREVIFKINETPVSTISLSVGTITSANPFIISILDTVNGTTIELTKGKIATDIEF